MANQYSVLIARASPVAVELWEIFGAMRAPIKGATFYLMPRSQRAAYMVDYCALDDEAQGRLRQHCQTKAGDAPGGDWHAILSRNGWPIYTEFVLAVVTREQAQHYIGSDMAPDGAAAVSSAPLLKAA